MTKTGNLAATTIAAAVLVATVVVVLATTREAEAAFPGQNGKIAFYRNADIWLMNPDGADQVNLTNTLADLEFHPSISPDGRKIAFDSTRVGIDWEIYTLDIYTGALAQVTNNTVNDSNPSWSPDGTQLAYEAPTSASGRTDLDIWTKSADGAGTATNVNPLSTSNDHAPSWSPNGSEIAHHIAPDYDIVVVNLDSGDARTISPNISTTQYLNPNWSPDGSRIVFQGSRDASSVSEIYSANSDGSGGLQQLTNNSFRDDYPAYSPDGARITFVRDDFGDNDIFTMNSRDDGTDVDERRITGTSSFDYFPDWQPNTAPSITGIRPTPGSRLRDRTPRIQAVVRDTQTDLDRPDIKLYMDGRAKPFSYNRSTNRLSHTTGRLSFGTHTARIVARDDVGLAGTKSWRFKVVR